MVHRRTQRHGAARGDLVAGFDAHAVEFRMPEKAYIHAYGHARLEDVVAVGTEEGRFGLVQSDRMHKRAHEVFREPVLVKIGSRWGVNLPALAAGDQLFPSQTERFFQMPQALLLALGITARDRQDIAYHAGIALLLVTSFFPPVYYGFLCEPFWMVFYLVTTTILGESST